MVTFECDKSKAFPVGKERGAVDGKWFNQVHPGRAFARPQGLGVSLSFADGMSALAAESRSVQSGNFWDFLYRFPKALVSVVLGCQPPKLWPKPWREVVRSRALNVIILTL